MKFSEWRVVREVFTTHHSPLTNSKGPCESAQEIAMRYRIGSTQTNQRRGMVLLVVMAMLALFASTAMVSVSAG